ncbi:MAG: GNAT family N-acetyltransferase [Candidatus Thermoplasmatota archaeon]|nr:GNAT family N-acetyltransferase [Candidatus Thermoplasmatota archaeon]
MRSHILSPTFQLLHTPLAKPGDNGLAKELLELCRYEPDLHISSLAIANFIIREHEGQLVFHRGTLVGAVFLYPRSAGWLEIGTLIVHHRYRTHGLGQLLLASLVARRAPLLGTTRIPSLERLLARLEFQRGRMFDLPQSVVASMLLNRTRRSLQLLKHRPAHFGHQLRYSSNYQLWVRLH